MHIHRHCSGLHRAEPVMIILRVKILDMAHRHNSTAGIKPVLAPADGIFIRHRPSVRPRNHRHPVRPQHMQLNGQSVLVADGLDITIPRQQQLRI